MNTVLWVLQIVLAVVFAAAGIAKIALPRDRLKATMGDWVDPVPAPAIKLLGLAEWQPPLASSSPHWCPSRPS